VGGAPYSLPEESSSSCVKKDPVFNIHYSYVVFNNVSVSISRTHLDLGTWSGICVYEKKVLFSK